MVLICSDKDTASASDGDVTLPLPLEFADFDLRSPKPFGIGLDRFNMFCLWRAEFAAASPWSEAFSSPLSCNEEPAPRRASSCRSVQNLPIAEARVSVR
jgi:hypothetical protein